MVLVFSGELIIHNDDEVTTDFDRNQTDAIRRFTFKLEPDQFITEDILNVTFTRFGGFDPNSVSRVDVILNGQNIAGSQWPFGRTEPISFDIEDVQHLIKFDGSKNTLIARVTQSALDGKNRWIIDSRLTYNLNTLDPPPEPPKVDPPETDEKGADSLTAEKVAGLVLLVGGGLLLAHGLGSGLGRGIASRRRSS